MINIPENLESLGRDALLKFAMEVKNQQALINFNEFNRLKFSPPPTPEGVEKLPKAPLPFSSWFEFRMFSTHLARLDYEPMSIDYVRKHKYTPGSIIPGTNLLVELKGAFEKDEPGKYQTIHEQTGYAFLFFFSAGALRSLGRSRERMEPELLMKNGLPIITTRKPIACLFTTRLKMSSRTSSRAEHSTKSLSVTK